MILKQWVTIILKPSKLFTYPLRFLTVLAEQDRWQCFTFHCSKKSALTNHNRRHGVYRHSAKPASTFPTGFHDLPWQVRRPKEGSCLLHCSWRLTCCIYAEKWQASEGKVKGKLHSKITQLTKQKQKKKKGQRSWCKLTHIKKQNLKAQQLLTYRSYNPHRVPQVFFTAIAFVLWFFGFVIIQQRMRTSSYSSSLLWEKKKKIESHNTALWERWWVIWHVTTHDFRSSWTLLLQLQDWRNISFFLPVPTEDCISAWNAGSGSSRSSSLWSLFFFFLTNKTKKLMRS